MTKSLMIIAASSLLMSASGLAQSGVEKSTTTANAQATVKNLPGDGAVKGDTQPKPSQVGVSAEVFKPKQPPVKPAAPPPSPKQ